MSEEHDCPHCERDFGSENALNAHRGLAHPDETRVEIECKQCGGVENVQPHRADEAKFCSDECYRDWYSDNVNGEDHPRWVDRVEVACKQCEAQFKLVPSEEGLITRCPECRDGGADVVKSCGWCGGKFKVHHYRAEEARFCSEECTGEWLSETITGESHPRWCGGDVVYGQGFTPKKKHAVRVRDQARCQHCGRTEPEHIEEFGRRHDIHHITPARDIDDAKERNAMENLITLCRGECHRVWEQMAPLRPDTAAQPAD